MTINPHRYDQIELEINLDTRRYETLQFTNILQTDNTGNSDGDYYEMQEPEEDINNEIIEYPLLNILDNQNKVWLTWISNTKFLNEGMIALIDNLEGYCSVYSETGKFLGNIELNETIDFKQSFTLLEILSSTGLQIKTDPGIPVIYIGFFFLMLSTLISYITYSQIWIIQKNQKLFIGGTTNRAIFDFELEFFKIIK